PFLRRPTGRRQRQHWPSLVALPLSLNERSPGAATISRAGANCDHGLDDRRARVKAHCSSRRFALASAPTRAKNLGQSLGLAASIVICRARPIEPARESDMTP